MKFFKLSFLSLVLGISSMIAIGCASDIEDDEGKGAIHPNSAQLNAQQFNNQQPISGKAKRRQQYTKRRQEEQEPMKQQQAQQAKKDREQAMAEARALAEQAGGDNDALIAAAAERQAANQENRQNRKNQKKQEQKPNKNKQEQKPLSTLWYLVAFSPMDQEIKAAKEWILSETDFLEREKRVLQEQQKNDKNYRDVVGIAAAKALDAEKSLNTKEDFDLNELRKNKKLKDSKKSAALETIHNARIKFLDLTSELTGTLLGKFENSANPPVAIGALTARNEAAKLALAAYTREYTQNAEADNKQAESNHQEQVDEMFKLWGYEETRDTLSQIVDLLYLRTQRGLPIHSRNELIKLLHQEKFLNLAQLSSEGKEEEDEQEIARRKGVEVVLERVNKQAQTPEEAAALSAIAEAEQLRKKEQRQQGRRNVQEAREVKQNKKTAAYTVINIDSLPRELEQIEEQVIALRAKISAGVDDWNKERAAKPTADEAEITV